MAPLYLNHYDPDDVVFGAGFKQTTPVVAKRLDEIHTTMLSSNRPIVDRGEHFLCDDYSSSPETAEGHRNHVSDERVISRPTIDSARFTDHAPWLLSCCHKRGKYRLLRRTSNS